MCVCVCVCVCVLQTERVERIAHQFNAYARESIAELVYCNHPVDGSSLLCKLVILGALTLCD
jgi:hypothetical protein